MITLSSLVSLVLTLAIVGFLVWVVITYVPMPEVFRRVIIGLVVILVLLWLLRLLGVLA